MLITLEETTRRINNGELLHIAAVEPLLAQLPRGNWIGGTTQYYMDPQGNQITESLLFVTTFEYTSYTITTYDLDTLKHVATDAYDHGYSLLIIPYDSEVHSHYALDAASFDDMFIKQIAGWVAGVNPERESQLAYTVNGQTGELMTDKAVALHLSLPCSKRASINIVNLFEPKPDSPALVFDQAGYSVSTCTVDGVNQNLATYLATHNPDIRTPLIGEFAGAHLNLSIRAIEADVVHFWTPAFIDTTYRLAQAPTNQEQALTARFATLDLSDSVFTVNCILNFVYGDLINKQTPQLAGPVTHGEIAYQQLNQTLVYITVSDIT